MLRPYDSTVQKRRGGTENDADTDTNERSLKAPLSYNSNANSSPANKSKNNNNNNGNNSSGKPDLFLRDKNINQPSSQRRLIVGDSDKGKQPALSEKKANITKKADDTKSFIPLKRAGSSGGDASHLDTPSAKRADNAPYKTMEIEYGFQPEEESPYVPDDISPLDLDLFDDQVHMDSLYQGSRTKLATNLYDTETFPTKIRQFQMENFTGPSKDSTSHGIDIASTRSVTESSFSIEGSIKNDISLFPSEIEYCPPREEELPDDPEDEPLDLSIFSGGVNISAYDLSKYCCEEELDFSHNLFDDDDLNLEPLDQLSFFEGSIISLEDLSPLFNDDPKARDKPDENDVDYSDIPFSNHIFEDYPIIV